MADENHEQRENEREKHRISHVQRTKRNDNGIDFWKIAAFTFAILLIASIATRGFTSFDLFTGNSPTGRATDLGSDINLTGAYYMGDADAPVTLIEYSDFMCPFCERFHKETFPRLKDNYIDTGKVRYIFVSYPALRHPVTEPAANAAMCAGEQEQYYEYISKVFDNFNMLRGITRDPTPELLTFAEQLGLNMNQFTSCVESDKYIDEVRENALNGSNRGVQATPTFFVNGVMVRGAQPYSVFEQYIEQAIEGTLPEPEPQQPVQPEPPQQQIPDTPEIIDFTVEGPMLGSDEAQISISDFSSYQCPFCQRFHMQTLPSLRTEYIDEGVVRMYARDFPLSMQPNSAPAANAAHCAGDQDAYFEYQSMLYQGQSAWASQSNPSETFIGYAEELNLDSDAFGECVETSAHAARVQSDFQIGQSAGISGTPSFLVLAPKENVDEEMLIELQMPDGRGDFFIRYVETNEGLAGARVVGAQPLEVFEAVIAALQ
jgi:protein-disulfide isomerase